MILTCHDCPRQLVFTGRITIAERIAALFGWSCQHGKFRCLECKGK